MPIEAACLSCLSPVRAWFCAVPAVVWAFVMLNALPEIVLQGADWGVWGSADWRRVAYSWGGFWPGLLDGWRPNFPAQPYMMFASYGFLHGGLSHLAVNMITLLVLGPVLERRIRAMRFVALYAGSVIGGAVGFALLSSGITPVVGASGALFGLAGAWVAWNYTDRVTAKERLLPAVGAVVWLVALNATLWWARDGGIAWQAHLGGFVTGWLLAGLLAPRTRPGAE